MRTTLPKKIGIVFFVLAVMNSTAGAFEFKNSPENLRELFETIMIANKKGDYASAAVLTKSLMPERQCAIGAFRQDTPKATIENIYMFHKKMIPVNLPDQVWAGMLTRKPERSQVLVHGATTEEMIRQEQGTVVWREFPGGAVRAAKTILKPGMKFYEVERVEPGKERGYKYHLIFWNGKKWCMLGGIWRVLPRKR
jgi:hypothetical protein